jgi:hypothetical protein
VHNNDVKGNLFHQFYHYRTLRSTATETWETWHDLKKYIYQKSEKRKHFKHNHVILRNTGQVDLNQRFSKKHTNINKKFLKNRRIKNKRQLRFQKDDICSNSFDTISVYELIARTLPFHHKPMRSAKKPSNPVRVA